MAWQKGPMPAGTYNWGGVVPAGEGMTGGFYFADFHGDHVILVGSGLGKTPDRVLQPEEVAWFDNGLELPPQD